MRGEERERETETETETERQTDRQTDRQTERQRQRQTDRQRPRDRQSQTETDRQTDRQIQRQLNRRTDKDRETATLRVYQTHVDLFTYSVFRRTSRRRKEAIPPTAPSPDIPSDHLSLSLCLEEQRCQGADKNSILFCQE